MADETPVEPATQRFAEQVGPAAEDRVPPRLSSALGAFAALMGAAAVAALAGEIVTDGATRVVGALVALAYGGGGWLLVVRGLPSQRSAGVVAIAVSVLMVFGFLILSGDFDRTDPATVLALSSIVWGILHVVGPTRGHPVLLAAALVGVWATVIVQIGLDSVFATVDAPFARSAADPFDLDPDASGAAVASLLFGCAYLAAGYALDRSALRGTATVFVGAAVAALGFGVFAATTGRGPWLTGLLLIAAGALVGFVGGALGRRLSTWLGAAVTVVGFFTLVDAAVADDETTIGALLALAVAGVVIMAVPLLAVAMGEPGGLRESDISDASPQAE